MKLVLAPEKKNAMEQSPLLAVDKPRIELLAQKVNHRTLTVCEADPLLK